MPHISVEVLKSIPPYQPGTIVRVAVDFDGAPLTKEWRRRLADAEQDECCRVLAPSASKPKKARRRALAPAKKELTDDPDSSA